VPDLLRFGAQGTIGGQEPLIFVAALSQLTTRIGLIATVSTTFHHPFNLARLFGTLDHVSNGRAAWNLVTSSVGEENREGSCAGAASSNRTTTAPRSAKLDLELP
jgi:alkanesulfonate monooxygenase SsuD/methylene tetrahydromethanopterin reductase-like flavin-dependent oxidoreductase (luciferase family)